MQSKNFKLEILNLNHAALQVEYYSLNKDHLEVWEPERSPNKFYTLKFQQNKIKESLVTTWSLLEPLLLIAEEEVHGTR